MAFLANIRRLYKIVVVEHRLPGCCYQLYFNMLDWLGVGFHTITLSNGLSIKGYTHCLSMFYEVWSKKDYDFPGFALQKDMIVIDIGANQGFFSLYAAAKGATVYAFEPCSDNFSILNENIQANGMENTINVFNAAVTGKNGQVPFFVGLNAAGRILSGSASTTNQNRGGKTVQTRSVNSVTLDTLLRDLHIDHCDFLKMDCEGAEYEILRTTSRTSFARIGRIAMECHSNRMFEAVAILQEVGFDVVCQTPGEAGVLKAINTNSGRIHGAS